MRWRAGAARRPGTRAARLGGGRPRRDSGLLARVDSIDGEDWQRVTTDDIESWGRSGPDTPLLDTVNFPVHIKVGAELVGRRASEVGPRSAGFRSGGGADCFGAGPKPAAQGLPCDEGKRPNVLPVAVG
eukprot:366013-Chlamydomonas_euryale.AAC.10